MSEKKFILSNDIKAIGFHNEPVYGTYVKGTKLSADTIPGSYEIHVLSNYGMNVGDVITIGLNNPNRVITSLPSSTQIIVNKPCSSVVDTSGSAVLLHYNMFKGHIQNIKIDFESKKTLIRNLEQRTVLNTDLSSHSFSSGRITMTYKLGEDCQFDSVSGKFSIYSSVIGLGIGKCSDLVTRKWIPREKTEELIPFSVFIRKVATPDDEYAESIYLGCVIDSMRIQSDEDEAELVVNIHFQREVKPDADFNILGSRYKSGTSVNTLPDYYRGKYFLSQGNTKITLFPTIRITKLEGKNLYLNDTSYFSDGDTINIIQGIYDNFISQTTSVVSVSPDKIEVSDMPLSSFEQFNSFVMVEKDIVIKELDLEIRNNAVTVPDLNMNGSWVRKVIGTNQEFNLRLLTRKFNEFIHNIKKKDSYDVLISAEILFDNGFNKLRLDCYYGVILDDAVSESNREPELVNEEINIHPSYFVYFIEYP